MDLLASKNTSYISNELPNDSTATIITTSNGMLSRQLQTTTVDVLYNINTVAQEHGYDTAADALELSSSIVGVIDFFWLFVDL